MKRRDGLILWRVLIGVAAASMVAAAETVTWTGASNNVWTNGNSSNWTGTYDNGDEVIFDDSGVNTDPITLAGTTVQPGGMVFANVVKSYGISNGVIAGAGGLIKTNAGLLKLFVASTNPVQLAFSGDVRIEGGEVRTYDNRVSGADSVWNHSLGEGTVTLNNGAKFAMWSSPSGSGGGHGIRMTNAVSIESGGGTIEINVRSNIRSDYNQTGPITLKGCWRFLANQDKKYYIHDVSLATNATIVSTNSTVGSSLRILRIRDSSGYTLNLAGNTDFLFETNRADYYVVGGITVTEPTVGKIALGWTDAAGGSSGNPTGVDLLSNLRSVGGKVTLATGGQVELRRGDWQLDDFVFPGSNLVSINVGGQNGTIYLPGGAKFSAASGDPVRMRFDAGQNNYLGINTNIIGGVTNELQFGDGGEFTVNAGGNALRVKGMIRFTHGSRLNILMSETANFFGRSDAGALRLGDGNPATRETIRITGLLGGSNTIGVAEIEYAPAFVVDDGNVVLRYENNAGGVTQRFNLCWDYRPFRQGSAGTIFAPAPGTLGFGAVGGPAGGTTGIVFTVTTNATVVTGGIVSFWNSNNTTSKSVRAALGEVKVAGGGTFQIEHPDAVVQASRLTVDGGRLGGLGKWQAAEVVFTNGAVWQVNIVGSGTNQAGCIEVSGPLVVVPDPPPRSAGVCPLSRPRPFSHPWRASLRRAVAYPRAFRVCPLRCPRLETVTDRRRWPATSGRGQAPPGGRRPPDKRRSTCHGLRTQRFTAPSRPAIASEALGDRLSRASAVRVDRRAGES
jgi:hypothetical protein